MKLLFRSRNTFMRLIFSALLVLLAVLPAWSQQLTKSVSGTVVDSETKKPLVFASISIKEIGISIVSNGEGFFTLKFPEEHMDKMVTISYLGYETIRVPLTSLPASSKNVTISLSPAPLPIPMTTVRPIDPLELVTMAFLNIDDNYPDQSMQMTGFYREMIRKGNTYVTLSEAVVDVFKAPYTSSFITEQVGIYKGRGSIDHQRIDTVFVKFQGGIRSSLEVDVVSAPFLGASLRELDTYYAFSMEAPVLMHDKINYVISFNQKPGTQEDILFRGKMYIESKTLAISRIEFNMNVEGNPKAASLFIRKKPAAMRAEVESASYVVQYKELADGKWTFDYSRTDLRFEAKWDKKLFKSTYTITSEMAMTEYSNLAYRIPQESRVKATDITLYRVADFEDPDFWEEYNVIEPESSIEHVISKIIRQLKRRK